MTHAYGIKSLKTLNGMDGVIVNCYLTKAGKKIAEVLDDGNGGCLSVHFYERAEDEEITAYVATLPEVTTDLMGRPHTYKPTVEDFINERINEEMKRKEVAKLARQSATTTFFRLSKDGRETYRTLKAVGKTATDYLNKKHAGDFTILTPEDIVGVAV